MVDISKECDMNLLCEQYSFMLCEQYSFMLWEQYVVSCYENNIVSWIVHELRVG